MLRAIIALNIFQLLYFNCKEPSVPKALASAVFCCVLAGIFYFMLKHMSSKHREANLRHAAQASMPQTSQA
jgi:hypothetical protein